MKNFTKIVGIIAIVAVMMVASSCVQLTSSSGTGGFPEYHGLFSGGAAKAAVEGGRSEVASYSVLLQLFDSGFAEYAAAVKAAEDAGKDVTVVITNIFIGVKYTAYVNN